MKAGSLYLSVSQEKVDKKPSLITEMLAMIITFFTTQFTVWKGHNPSMVLFSSPKEPNIVSSNLC